MLSLGQLGSNLIASTPTIAIANGVGTVSGGGLNVSSLMAADRVSLSTATAFVGVFQIISVGSGQFTIATNLTSAPALSSIKRLLSIGRVIVEGNVIELAPGLIGEFSAVSILDNDEGGTAFAEPPDYAHGDVLIRNNKVRYVDGVLPDDEDATLFHAEGAKNLNVESNVMNTIASKPLLNVRCGNVSYFNNRTPAGKLKRGFNGDLDFFYGELETDAEDAFLIGYLERG
jgi:hypothetical protein